MNRRRFLQRSGAAASGLLLSSQGLISGARAQVCTSGRLPGAQLWTIRDLLRDNPRSALASLGRLGIREVELFGIDDSGETERVLFGLSAAEFRDALQAAGLTMSMSTIQGDWSRTGELADMAQEIGIRTLVVGLPDIFAEVRDNVFNMVAARSRGELDLLADQLNSAASEYRALGLTLAYHNHHIEFIPVEGVVPFDYLMERTDPELVKIELDVGWASAGHVDPPEYLNRYLDRVISCHLKDYDASREIPDATRHIQNVLPAIVEPGAGNVDFATVLGIMEDAGIQHGFVEIDIPADPLAAIERGLAHARIVSPCGESA